MDKSKLTPAQAEHLNKIEAEVKQNKGVQKPQELAESAFKRLYKLAGDKWERIKEDMSESEVTAAIAESLKEKETFNIDDIEICKIGNWQGRVITKEDLKNIKAAYEDGAFSDGVPLAVEHPEDDDRTKEGKIKRAASYGWLKNLKVIGDTLFGSFKDIPRLIKEMIQTGQFRHRSVGIRRHYWDENKQKRYAVVLEHIALLGWKAPGVKGMRPIPISDFYIDLYKDGNKETERLFSEVDENGHITEEVIEYGEDCYAYCKGESRYFLYKDKSGSVQASLIRKALEDVQTSDLSQREKELAQEELFKAARDVQDQDVELKEILVKENRRMKIEERLAQLEDQQKAQEKTITDLQAENKKLREEKLEAVAASRKTEATVIVDSAVKEGKIIPASRGMYESMLIGSSKEDKVELEEDGKKIEVSAFEKAKRDIGALPVVTKFQENTKNVKKEESGLEGFTAKDIDEYGDEREQKIDFLVQKYQADNKDTNYEVAYLAIEKSNPELFKLEEE